MPAPAAIEIDALRLALRDRQLGRIDPHVTIIPPINLREGEIADAMAVCDAAAAACGPCELTLGPIETFATSSPTRYLRVAPWAPVEAVYRACWTGVFEREEKRSFVPHVTVDIDGGPTDGPDPALDLLSGYTCDVVIDELTLLEHHSDDAGRRWEPYARYRLTGNTVSDTVWPPQDHPR